MPAAKTKAALIPIQESISPAEEADEFVPRAVLATSFRFWWVVAAFAVVGGMLGWLAHRLNPPVYEAVGGFSASIDFVSTGPLTQFEEDIALNAIGDLISSKPVLDAVEEKAGEEGIVVTLPELLKMATSERRVNTWDLRIRHQDPTVANRIANIWIEQGQAVLLQSYQHALRAAALGRYVRTLENCLAAAAASEPSQPLCNRYHSKDIQTDLREAGDALYQERVASRGLFAGLIIGPVHEAVLGGAPVQFGQGRFVLAGGFIGMLVGMGLIQAGLLTRWNKRN